MADGRSVETENLKKIFEAISKIKIKKEGHYKQKIIQVSVEEFILKQEEGLTSLKKFDKNSKNFYRVVQETHLDEECVVDNQIGEALKSSDDLSIRLDKTSYDNLTNLANLANEFRLLKTEI